jgi:uncharacterized protein YndB with AHSA1/START domain
MTDPTWHHDRVEASRDYAASAHTLFTAFADNEARRHWAAPPGQQVEFDSDDFRVGGACRYRCGPAGSLRFEVTGHYLEIVEDSRVVVAERVAGPDGLLSTALVTWHFERTDGGTRAHVVAQVSAPVPDMVAGMRDGLAGSLGSLERYLVTR